MRVSFSTKLKPESGKQNFAIRLANEFRKKGIKVTDKKPHINLVFLKGVKPGCINIMRLDGALINSKINSAGKNSRIASQMKKCKAVIYQSGYSKRVCRTFMGKMKRYKVIFNGCDPNVFREKYEHPKPYILTCSRWRPHKRLKTVVDGFLESGLSKEYDLIVCGKDPDYVVKDTCVHYFGHKSIKDVQKIVAGCKFVVHLAYLDCCPNSVVESLVAGKEVLHSDTGGTPELVGDSGVCISDEPYNFKMIELYKPPLLSMDDVVSGYIKLSKSGGIEPRKDLFIENIANKYIKYMNSFLR